MTVNGSYGRKRQLRPKRVGGGSAGTCALALAIACLLVAAPAGAAQQSAEHNVTVNPKPIYTDTGIAVHKGDTVTITASGKLHFGGGQISALDPAGIPWGKQCDDIANPQFRSIPWPLKGAPCWSLLGRIGRAKPIEIGPSKTFTADRDGKLFLGVNDNFVRDNEGSWDAKVTVTPAGVAPPSTSSGGSSSALIFVLLGAVLLIALGLLFFFLRRRRKARPGDEAAPAPAAFPPPPVVPGAMVLEPAHAAAPAPEPAPEVPAIPIAPPDPESIDVNIFEVEFTNGLQLRVGYNHFPDGTPVNWRVTQSRKPVAVGSFVAQGGGSTNHYETMPLGVKLQGRDSEPDGADVQFNWNVNGVPFRYSVRRDPNC